MAEESDLVLLFSRNPVSLGDILCRQAHMVSIKGFEKTIEDHEIDHGLIVHPCTPAAKRECIGDLAHVFHASGNDGISITYLDGLCSQCNGL